MHDAPPVQVVLTDALREQLHAAAESAYPAEACGLVIRTPEGELLCWPCENIAPTDQAGDRFVIAPADFAAGQDQGDIVAIFHSHPNACANPSTADRVFCERSGLPWLIVGWPSGVIVQVEPEGWQAPLIGREFVFGVLDCYTLIQDHFQRELGIALPDFEREDEFWRKGEELYLDNFKKAGFVEVGGEVDGELQPHDVILMQVASDVTNHGAVYLGDGTILHHLYGRLSGRDVYGGYWLRHTRLVVRHQSRVAA